MKKDEFFNLIMKAMAICLFVLAIISLPVVVSILIQFVMHGKTILSVFFGEATIGQTMMVATMSMDHFLSHLLIFLAYILIGRDLFNGGSWIKYILRKRPRNIHNIRR